EYEVRRAHSQDLGSDSPHYMVFIMSEEKKKEEEPKEEEKACEEKPEKEKKPE
ncbi:unnamed protein product, partial [marine sediment metagenome]